MGSLVLHFDEEQTLSEDGAVFSSELEGILVAGYRCCKKFVENTYCLFCD